MRRLQIESPSSSLSSAIDALVSHSQGLSMWSASEQQRFVLAMVVGEAVVLMAMARVWADEKKAARAVNIPEPETPPGATPEDTAKAIAALQALADFSSEYYGGIK